MTLIELPPICIPIALNFWVLNAIGNVQDVLPFS